MRFVNTKAVRGVEGLAKYSQSNVVQWNPSNPDTIGPEKCPE